MMEIGPIAVHPEFQKQGYGSKLMDTVERRGNASKYTVGVVSCRTDIIPFFEKRGYKVSSSFEFNFCGPDIMSFCTYVTELWNTFCIFKYKYFYLN